MMRTRSQGVNNNNVKVPPTSRPLAVSAGTSTHDVAKNLAQGNPVDVELFDVTKAFDNAPHHADDCCIICSTTK